MVEEPCVWESKWLLAVCGSCNKCRYWSCLVHVVEEPCAWESKWLLTICGSYNSQDKYIQEISIITICIRRMEKGNVFVCSHPGGNPSQVPSPFLRLGSQVLCRGGTPLSGSMSPSGCTLFSGPNPGKGYSSPAWGYCCPGVPSRQDLWQDWIPPRLGYSPGQVMLWAVCLVWFPAGGLSC